ncbi:hypothetical protein M3J09_002043 [Ascochyta lentis]
MKMGGSFATPHYSGECRQNS